MVTKRPIESLTKTGLRNPILFNTFLGYPPTRTEAWLRNDHIYSTLCLFFGGIEVVDKARESSTHQRGHNKEPEVAPSRPAIGIGKEALAEGTCRVDTGVGQGNRDKVD